MNTKKVSPKMSRRLLSATIVAMLAASGSAAAGEVYTGNPDASCAGTTPPRQPGHRVEGQDASILNSPNFDDGDRNFDAAWSPSASTC
jgi:hypothetical protein